jgi:glycosyltransferase involved in cell wall biosynthesis
MILDKIFPPDPRVENEALALIEGGHQVFLFSLRYNDNSESEIINKIHIKRYLSNRLEYKLSALAYSLPFYSNFMAKKIVHFLDQNKIEIIHIHDMVIAEAVFKANKKMSLPVVLDLHENKPEIMKLYPHLLKFPGKQIISPDKWKNREEHFIKKADKTIVVTKEAKEEIKNRINIRDEKIVIVPNTVRKSFYNDAKFDNYILNKYKNKFVILYLGDTGLRRGLLTAIEAVEKLKLKIENLTGNKADLKLVIVGKNSDDPILRNKIKELNLENYVDLEGWKDVNLFPSYIVSSAIGISPLHRNIHHDTTYANKIFQYMSFAKPVLVSDATAQKNLINKTESGLVHKEMNAGDFAEKAIELYKDENLRKTLGNNGKKFIENDFCWEKVSKNLVDIYNNLD